jgi:hypothetical protein
MEFVAPGTYRFELAISFPSTMKNPFELPAGMAMDFETTGHREAAGEITLKGPVEKDALAKWLAADTYKDLRDKDLTVTRLELTQTAQPGASEDQLLIDYMDCFRVATEHVDACVACQNEQYCPAGAPILEHFVQAQDAYQQRENIRS